MLKGIPKILTPDLLATLARMGHGDEILLADANFPGERLNRNIIRCDGSEIPDLLKAVLQLFPLDKFVETPWLMMKPADLTDYDDHIEKSYHRLLLQSDSEVGQAEKIERFKFYKRAWEAYAKVMTGTAKRFGNIMIKKGTILL